MRREVFEDEEMRYELKESFIAALLWSTVAMTVLLLKVLGIAWFTDLYFEICIFYLPAIVLWIMVSMELRRRDASGGL